MPVSPGLGLGGGKNDDELEVLEVVPEVEVVVPPSNEGFFWLWLFWLTLFWPWCPPPPPALRWLATLASELMLSSDSTLRPSCT
jgi:hypothetical protein